MDREPLITARRDNQGHKETFGGEEDCYFDVLIAEEMHNMSKLIKTHILNTGSLAYFNYTPNKVMAFFKEKNMLLNTCTMGLALSHRWESFCHPLGWPQGGERGHPQTMPCQPPDHSGPGSRPHPADPHNPDHTRLLH